MKPEIAELIATLRFSADNASQAAADALEEAHKPSDNAEVQSFLLWLNGFEEERFDNGKREQINDLIERLARENAQYKYICEYAAKELPLYKEQQAEIERLEGAIRLWRDEPRESINRMLKAEQQRDQLQAAIDTVIYSDIDTDVFTYLEQFATKPEDE